MGRDRTCGGSSTPLAARSPTFTRGSPGAGSPRTLRRGGPEMVPWPPPGCSLQCGDEVPVAEGAGPDTSGTRLPTLCRGSRCPYRPEAGKHPLRKRSRFSLTSFGARDERLNSPGGELNILARQRRSAKPDETEKR
jgi:hypothetical protein